MRCKLLCISVTGCPFLFPSLQEQNRNLTDRNLALKACKNSFKRAVLYLCVILGVVWAQLDQNSKCDRHSDSSSSQELCQAIF